MTSEEFGLELFEAIKTCSKVQQLLGIISIEVDKNRDTTELAAEYGKLKAQAKLLVQSPAISDQDAARLMREYPWLAH